jgi:hypothetical protein
MLSTLSDQSWGWAKESDLEFDNKGPGGDRMDGWMDCTVTRQMMEVVSQSRPFRGIDGEEEERRN